MSSINNLSKEYLNIKLNNQKHKKHINRYQKTSVKASDSGQEIRTQIRQVSDAKILDILSNNEINDPSIYSVAMQKCNSLRNFSLTKEIMNYAIENNRDILNIIVFNSFFNGMVMNDNMGKCKEYFELMVNELNIKPDIVTFGILFKGIKYQASVMMEWGNELYQMMKDMEIEFR